MKMKNVPESCVLGTLVDRCHVCQHKFACFLSLLMQGGLGGSCMGLLFDGLGFACSSLALLPVLRRQESSIALLPVLWVQAH